MQKCTWDGLVTRQTWESYRVISLLVTGWTIIVLRSYYHQNARLAMFMPSINNLCNFLMAVQMRLFFQPMLRLDVWAWQYNVEGFCEYFGLLETLLAVYEVEALTHLCIERYVVAKYVTRGWPLERKHYVLYVCLCLLFASLYSTSPLYGIGKYGEEFTCTSCTVDYVLPDAYWPRNAMIAIYFLRSVKPVAFMIIMLYWAGRLELNMTPAMKSQIDLRFTMMITALTCVTLASWTPLALVRAKLLLNQFLFNHLEMPSPCLLNLAYGIQELSPLLGSAVILVFHYTRDPIDHVRAE